MLGNFAYYSYSRRKLARVVIYTPRSVPLFGEAHCVQQISFPIKDITDISLNILGRKGK